MALQALGYPGRGPLHVSLGGLAHAATAAPVTFLPGWGERGRVRVRLPEATRKRKPSWGPSRARCAGGRGPGPLSPADSAPGPFCLKVPPLTHVPCPAFLPQVVSRCSEGGRPVSLRGRGRAPCSRKLTLGNTRSAAFRRPVWPLPAARDADLVPEVDVCDPGAVLGPGHCFWWLCVGGWPRSPELWPLAQAPGPRCRLPAPRLRPVIAEGGVGEIKLWAGGLERKLRHI